MSNVIPFQRRKTAAPFRRMLPVKSLSAPYFYYEPQFCLPTSSGVGMAVDVGEQVPSERLEIRYGNLRTFLRVAFGPLVQTFKVILSVGHHLHRKLSGVADVGCRVGEQRSGESLQHGKSAAHLDFKIVHLKSFQGNKDPEEKA